MKKEYIVELTETEADELMDAHWIGELVRCKDCRYYSTPQIGYETGACLIKAGYFPVKPDWFCADGERR